MKNKFFIVLLLAFVLAVILSFPISVWVWISGYSINRAATVWLAMNFCMVPAAGIVVYFLSGD